ncbi:hypothetical protein PVAP13_4NG332375 [Panicum virgatum]|uniref:Uncharacterized protein n=1 Tax=Panicum virgatum TaxID=38727 RepID=A0A8T0TKK5_PANVG|nr:hypothetical protein PVAP13_4NG332375 [Panicum virgatum]
MTEEANCSPILFLIFMMRYVAIVPSIQASSV